MADEQGGFPHGKGGNHEGQDGWCHAGAPPPGRVPLPRRRLLQGAGTLAVGAVLWPGNAAAASSSHLEQLAAPAAAGRAVPRLDELAGAWMPAGTLLGMPSVNNFHGGLHAGWNLLSFLELTFPPLSLGGE